MVPFYLSILIAILGFWLFTIWLKKRRRQQITQKEFPSQWEEILKNNVSVYSLVPLSLRLKLQKLIQVFLAEKNFTGCLGLIITDEIKVTIAAQACLLLLNKKHDYYPQLKNIFVYPHAFQSIKKTTDGILEHQEKLIRSGESWVSGPVVLSWSHSLWGGKRGHDGENVVLHEFAHQLDQLDGASDGIPDLPNGLSQKMWVEIMNHDYRKFCQKVSNGYHTLIDEYGATSPAEFFAVLTEVFFEKPQKLFQEHPDLYEVLKKFYGLNPKDWEEGE